MVLPNSHRVPRVPWYLGSQFRKSDEFAIQDYHLLWLAFPNHSDIHQIGNFPTKSELRQTGPLDPKYATPPSLARIRFGLFPFRSPLLWKSRLFSFPEDTKMFQFSSLASSAYVFS
jgi:hypothetical protein